MFLEMSIRRNSYRREFVEPTTRCLGFLYLEKRRFFRDNARFSIPGNEELKFLDIVK